MPEVLGNPPSPRTALFWNGTAWQWALVDAAGHLQIDADTELPAAAALSDGAANPTTPIVGAAQLVYNGSTWDIVRGPEEHTLLASALRTVSINSPVQTNFSARGVLIFVNVTARTGDETITAYLMFRDPASGAYFVVAGTGAINAVGHYGIIVYPGVTAAVVEFTAFANIPLPRRWRVDVVHTGTGSMTYSIGACYVMA